VDLHDSISSVPDGPGSIGDPFHTRKWNGNSHDTVQEPVLLSFGETITLLDRDGITLGAATDVV
jgi:hypothetical protein